MTSSQHVTGSLCLTRTSWLSPPQWHMPYPDLLPCAVPALSTSLPFLSLNKNTDCFLLQEPGCEFWCNIQETKIWSKVTFYNVPAFITHTQSFKSKTKSDIYPHGDHRPLDAAGEITLTVSYLCLKYHGTNILQESHLMIILNTSSKFISRQESRKAPSIFHV